MVHRVLQELVVQMELQVQVELVERMVHRALQELVERMVLQVHQELAELLE